MENEKKIKLEELPDAGSEPEKIVVPPVVKSKPEPRIENLRTLDHPERVEALSQRWHFDKQRMKWGWIFCLLGLMALEKSKILHDMHAEKIRVEKPADRIGAMIFDNPEVEFVMRHPLIFAILIPFLFKLKESSNDFFEITFNGIDAVKTIDVPPFHPPTRVKLKWDEIKEVNRATVKGREVLELYSIEGPAAQMIWDIAEIKKKVVRQVLKSLVSAKHPMRIFMEKEIT